MPPEVKPQPNLPATVLPDSVTDQSCALGHEPYTGADLAREVYDLMCRRLPQLPADDDFRPLLAELLPALGESLGQPRLYPVVARRTES